MTPPLPALPARPSEEELPRPPARPLVARSLDRMLLPAAFVVPLQAALARSLAATACCSPGAATARISGIA